MDRFPKNLKTIESGCFSGCDNLEYLNLQECFQLREIGSNCFENCKNLSVVQLPYNLARIGNEAFQNCENLVTCNIPDNTNEIGNYAFSNCIFLRNIRINNNASHIYPNAFFNCPNLDIIEIFKDNKNFNISDGFITNTDSSFKTLYYVKKTGNTLFIPDGVLTIISDAISNQPNLKKIIINDECRQIGSISNCPELTDIEFGKSMDMYSEFYIKNCPKLTSFKVKESNKSFICINGCIYTKDLKEFVKCPPGLKECEILSGVEILRRSCFSYGNIENVIIPEGVIEIKDSFNNCENLKSIKLPESLQIIGYQCFLGCTELDNIKIPLNTRFEYDSNPFIECTNLYNLEISPNNPFYKLKDGILLSGIYDNKILGYFGTSSHLVISDDISEIKYIGNKNLESITIPASVKDIDYHAFDNCDNLASVYLKTNIPTYEISNHWYSATTYIPKGSFESYLSEGWIGCRLKETEMEMPHFMAIIDSKDFKTDEDLNFLYAENILVKNDNGNYTGYYHFNPGDTFYFLTDIKNINSGVYYNGPCNYILEGIDPENIFDPYQMTWRCYNGLTTKKTNKLFEIPNDLPECEMKIILIPEQNSVNFVWNNAHYPKNPEIYVWGNFNDWNLKDKSNVLKRVGNSRYKGTITINKRDGLNNFYFFYVNDDEDIITFGPNNTTKLFGKTSFEDSSLLYYDDIKVRYTTDICDMFELPENYPGGSIEMEVCLSGATSFTYGKELNGIEEIIASDKNDNNNSVFYNLQGIKVENPQNGIFVRILNGQACKVRL